MIERAPAHCCQTGRSARICRLLSGTDCGQAACVSRSWRRVLCDDVLWRDLLWRDYGLITAQGPDGALANTFRCTKRQNSFHASQRT